MSAENGVPEMLRFAADCWVKFEKGHSEHLRDDCRLVLMLRSRASKIEFLQANHIRIHSRDHPRYPFRRELLIRANAAVDVVREHAVCPVASDDAPNSDSRQTRVILSAVERNELRSQRIPFKSATTPLAKAYPSQLHGILRLRCARYTTFTR